MSEMPHQGTLTGRITIGEMNDNNGNQCFELVPFMRIYFYGLANIDRRECEGRLRWRTKYKYEKSRSDPVESKLSSCPLPDC